MRVFIVLSVIATTLSSCASIEQDDYIQVQGVDRWPSGGYYATHDRPTTKNDKYFSVVAGYAAVKRYGPDPQQAVEKITTEIVSTRGYCPNGYTIDHNPLIGMYRKGEIWKIICID